jgi:hypothetical protein
VGRPKKEVNNRLISYKFLKKNGGSVEFAGIGEDEDFPKEIEEVLSGYGFVIEPDSGKWVDCLSPQGGEELDWMFDGLPKIVPVSLASSLKKGKRKSMLTFLAEVGSCGECESKSCGDAIMRAFNAWNKANRPINDSTITEELDSVIEKVNASR